MPVERLRYIGVVALRGRRMRRVERVARAWRRRQYLSAARSPRWCRSRTCGPRAARAGGWRECSRWAAARALVRHAAPAARLGVRADDGDVTTRTFFCGDLFTQGGAGEMALTESDILGPSEASASPWITSRTRRKPPPSSNGSPRERPTTLACMHGSAWRGDGAALLRALAQSLSSQPQLQMAA